MRTILLKNGGRLGETGSTSHLFINCGVLRINKSEISEEKVLELAVNSGAKECISNPKFHEILTEKEDFYKIKTLIEKKIKNFQYSAIEWRPHSILDLKKDGLEKISLIFDLLDQNDDVQNIFTNCNITSN